MSKEETQEALKQALRIVDEWRENKLESYEAMEMLSPLLEIIKVHFERIQDKKDELTKKETPGLDLEGLEDEKLEDMKLFEPEEDLKLEQEQKDLFKKKAEDLESEEEDPNPE